MSEEDERNDGNEQAAESDAREEDVVRDEDADTRDVEETEREDNDATERRFSSIEATLDRILGEISSIREAQGIMVENGAVVTEPEVDLDFTGDDAFVPPAELDLLI